MKSLVWWIAVTRARIYYLLTDRPKSYDWLSDLAIQLRYGQQIKVEKTSWVHWKAR